ncbi:hypothetical protein J4412_01995 [Candidatus Pacearchaeota archaeon]|nr:MAG: hypothetical protein QJ16_C0005G0130 [archaeon GW2011_AR1]MBS3078254.1 hypothetical protein [Candidatus Pacearchaeota archaeon]HIH52611.1 hypothetical protein [Nanoarchaeota archaeon]
MNWSLIASGVIGLILAWATWESYLFAAMFAGVVGAISLIAGFFKN